MPQISQDMRDALKNHGVRAVARETGLNPGTVQRAISTGKASETATVKLEAIRGRLRQKDEFKNATPVAAPRRITPALSWSLETIRAARDAQMLGQFSLPVSLARAMRTDDALFTAYHNRIAPQMAIDACLEPAPGARGERVKSRAQTSCIVPKAVLASIQGTLANHGIAIGYVQQAINDEGTRIDFRLTEWPLEFVRWLPSSQQLVTRVLDGGSEVPIVHGDSRWIVFQKFEAEPWTQEACLLPAALLWAAHANGVADWAMASKSHGRPGLVGELPAGLSTFSAPGVMTAEAREFLSMLADISSGEVPAGIRPAGSKTDLLFNGSTAWQVFAELILDRKKAAAYIYLGTDATLGAQGGAPGVDISALFGVATTKIQGDFAAIQEGLRTGLYEPWTALNEGDSRYAPTLVYQIPDTDSQEQVEQADTRRAKFFARLAEYKEAGMLVDQETVDCLAAEYKIDAPTLAPAAARSVPLALAPTDIAKVTRVDEVRASQGLPPIGDTRGHLTIPELDALAKSQTAEAKAQADAQAAAGAAPAAPAPGAA